MTHEKDKVCSCFYGVCGWIMLSPSEVLHATIHFGALIIFKLLYFGVVFNALLTLCCFSGILCVGCL